MGGRADEPPLKEQQRQEEEEVAKRLGDQAAAEHQQVEEARERHQPNSLVKLNKLLFELSDNCLAEAWFGKMDEDGNGFLSPLEIANALMSCGLTFQSEWDPNRDGKVSNTELLSP